MGKELRSLRHNMPPKPSTEAPAACAHNEPFCALMREKLQVADLAAQRNPSLQHMPLTYRRALLRFIARLLQVIQSFSLLILLTTTVLLLRRIHCARSQTSPRCNSSARRQLPAVCRRPSYLDCVTTMLHHLR